MSLTMYVSQITSQGLQTKRQLQLLLRIASELTRSLFALSLVLSAHLLAGFLRGIALG